MSTKSLQSLLTIASTKRTCEVFRCRTQALIHLLVANPKWRKTQDVWTCAKHQDAFTKAATDAGCTVEVLV